MNNSRPTFTERQFASPCSKGGWVIYFDEIEGTETINNIDPETHEETEVTYPVYSYLSATTEGDLSKETIVDSIIRFKYSLSNELALHRQRTTKKTEFNEYNAFAEAAKTRADEILNHIYPSE